MEAEVGRKKSIQELYPNLNPKYIAPEDLKHAYKNRNKIGIL